MNVVVLLEWIMSGIINEILLIIGLISLMGGPLAATVICKLILSARLTVLVWIIKVKIVNVFLAYKLEFIIEWMPGIYVGTLVTVRSCQFRSRSACFKRFFHPLLCDWVQRDRVFLAKIEVIVAVVFMDLAVLIADKIVNQIFVGSLSAVFGLLA